MGGFFMEQDMLGMTVTHTSSGITGTVDAVSVDPEGRPMVRVNDRWFLADEMGATESA